MSRLEKVVLGTEEKDYKDGIKGRFDTLEDQLARSFRWLNRWGFALLSAVLGAGLFSGPFGKFVQVLVSGK